MIVSALPPGSQAALQVVPDLTKKGTTTLSEGGGGGGGGGVAPKPPRGRKKKRLQESGLPEMSDPFVLSNEDDEDQHKDGKTYRWGAGLNHDCYTAWGWECILLFGGLRGDGRDLCLFLVESLNREAFSCRESWVFLIIWNVWKLLDWPQTKHLLLSEQPQFSKRKNISTAQLVTASSSRGWAISLMLQLGSVAGILQSAVLSGAPGALLLWLRALVYLNAPEWGLQSVQYKFSVLEEHSWKWIVVIASVPVCIAPCAVFLFLHSQQNRKKVLFWIRCKGFWAQWLFNRRGERSELWGWVSELGGMWLKELLQVNAGRGREVN